MKRQKAKEFFSIIAAILMAFLLFLFLLLGLKFQILLAMGLSICGYGILTILFKPTDRIGRYDISGLQNGEQLQEKLQEAREDYDRISEAADQMKDQHLQKMCRELLEIAESILRYLMENPQKIAAARRYIDYYQETAANVAEKYVSLQDARLTALEMEKTRSETAEALETLKEAFQMQFDKLVQNEILDMEADLNLLKETLKAEGYQEKRREEK